MQLQSPFLLYVTHVSYQSIYLVLGFLLQFYHVFQLDHGFLLLSLGIPTYARQTATELTSAGKKMRSPETWQPSLTAI